MHFFLALLMMAATPAPKHAMMSGHHLTSGHRMMTHGKMKAHGTMKARPHKAMMHALPKPTGG